MLRPNSGEGLREILCQSAMKFQKTYISRQFPSSAEAAMHLLSFYKESGHFDLGIEFWNYLLKEELDRPNLRLFGAGIELMAFYGAGIKYCEDLYERAIDQHPATVNLYHLSPNALLPDRSKPIRVENTSMGLLQGILTARLYYRQWQGSYLTLDTAFRLRPTQMPSRILDVFLYERPLHEALQVFAMYCRGGNVVKGSTLMRLFEASHNMLSSGIDIELDCALVQGMFYALELFVGSDGLLDTRHLNALSKAIVSLMPSYPTKTPTASLQGAQDLTTAAIKTLARLVTFFTERGVPPNEVTFYSIILSASRAGNRFLVQSVIQDMKKLDLRFSLSRARGFLRAVRCLLPLNSFRSALW